MGALRWLHDQETAPWDIFVSGHDCGWLCHLSGWKRALEKSFPHIRGRIAVIIDEQTGAIKAGLPVYHVRSLLTGSRLVCAPFATLFDPLVSSREQLDLLLEALCRLAAATASPRIEIRTLCSAGFFSSPAFEASCGYKLHVLDLNRSPEELLRSFNYSNIRQNIARARKAPLRAYRAASSRDLAVFYSLYVATRRRLGLPSLPLRFFEALWDEFAPARQVVVLIAQYGDRPVAALLALHYRGRFSADYLAWDRSFKNVAPSPFILWEAIQYACEAGCSTFDFGRTSVHNTGLLEFKRRWGAQEHDLREYRCPPQAGRLSAAQGGTSLGYRLFRYVCGMAPDPLYRILSGACYRHLG